MLTFFQILGLIIPVSIILGIFMYLCHTCKYPDRTDEDVKQVHVIALFLSLFILGFTLGTIVMGGS